MVLLSSLSGIPINQAIAVTGSVNQKVKYNLLVESRKSKDISKFVKMRVIRWISHEL